MDVGCGVGTWLSVSAELGASNVLGLEGPWLLDQPRLAIDRDKIRLGDLSQGVVIPRSFDLGISLEVAEHLPESAGRTLVQSLARHCKIVVFSAAIPGQGGVGHINEQRPTYWQELFRQEGFEALDVIRPLIWYRDDFPWWYRQNIIVYTSPAIAQKFLGSLSKTSDFKSSPITDGWIQPKQSYPPNESFFSKLKRKILQS